MPARSTKSSRPAKAPQVIAYPAAPGASKSIEYSVSVNGVPVFVEHWEDLHIAHFAFTGKCEVTASIKPSIGHRNLKFVYKYSILPSRADIQPQVELNRITFTLDKPKKLVIQANEYQRLILFAEAIVPNEPKLGAKGVVNAADYAKDATGATLVTDGIKAAIAATPKGGVCYFPQGVYRTGTVCLKSDMTLYLAAGAMIKGSTDPEDYAIDERDHWAGRKLLLIRDAKNVKVMGHGVIDGSGTILRAMQHGPHLIHVRNSRNILFEGVFHRDPAAWNTHVSNSDDVTMRNVKVVDNRDVLNTDGFDPDGAHGMLVEDCFAYCSDDCVAVKTFQRDARDVIIRNCVFITKKSALKCGTESHHDMTNITFEGNDVVECDRGMSLYVEDGGVYKNIRYVDNRFDLFYYDARQRLIDFYIWKRNGESSMEDILVKDCVAATHWPRPSTIIGLDDKHEIKNVRFENLRIAGKLCRNLADANMYIEVYPFEDVRLPHVKNVTFAVTE